MKKCLVTGGSGFIGTNLIEHMTKKGWVILNIDNVAPKEKKHLYCYKSINILDYYKLNKTILDFQPDYVVHLAGRTDLYGKHLNDYKCNIEGVLNLIKSIKNYNYLFSFNLIIKY